MAHRASGPVQGMRAIWLDELLRHMRPDTTEQVRQALKLVSDAPHPLRRDPEAVLCACNREVSRYR